MVSLNVLDHAGEMDLHRVYRRGMSLWCAHVADEMAFGPAAAFANAKLPAIPEANCVLGEVTLQQAQAIEAYFREAHTRPLAWFCPSGMASPGQLAELRDRPIKLMHLASVPRDVPQLHAELTLIPARSSFRHVREVAAAMRPGVEAEQAGEAACCHLDDPHVDAVLALSDGQAVGYTAVLSTGDAGLVTDLFVRPDRRGRGYGRALAGRAFDICHRSLFKQVICALPEDEPASIAFAVRMGFDVVEQVAVRT